MSGNLVELAQRFVRLSGELDLTRDAMRRLLLNGAGGTSKNPTPAKRPGAKRPQSSHPKALRRLRSKRRSSSSCNRRREMERRRSRR
jgi:hypothetical protein